ncbi:DUF6522 family protein [Aquibium sp. A9E412]|uniref:DUF6522 family protein n=1 Tax=Aquibium sp. A9E412 TaxID=2976767 RepID=UPI0025AF81AE|nr:DUF6522 family protein [Aquibium sp. A9E412]MDN2566314.1 DUF6522 family protein [Aquibium sp. A9E412]
MSRLTVSDDGFVVDAELLGAAFGLAPAAVPEKLRAGAITSLCEAGVDADAGRWRLTFYHAGRALRLVVDGDGTILSRGRFDAHPPRPARPVAAAPDTPNGG